MSQDRYVPPEEWLENLDLPTRAKADRMIALLERFHARHPVGWVASEMREGIPQMVRFFFLHGVRTYVLNGSSPFHVPTNPNFEQELSSFKRIEGGQEAFKRLLKSGAEAEDVVRVAQAAVASAVDEFIAFLDHVYEYEWDDLEDAPSWVIKERQTGRILNGLHESFGSLYKTDK